MNNNSYCCWRMSHCNSCFQLHQAMSDRSIMHALYPPQSRYIHPEGQPKLASMFYTVEAPFLGNTLVIAQPEYLRWYSCYLNPDRIISHIQKVMGHISITYTFNTL